VSVDSEQQDLSPNRWCFQVQQLDVTEPPPPHDLCRRVARVALGRERIHHIDTLPLPQTLKNYLQYHLQTELNHNHQTSAEDEDEDYEQE
ncbi:hypothetical protein KUCAC02_035163, partial [Chaenocephalus aceratus]